MIFKLHVLRGLFVVLDRRAIIQGEQLCGHKLPLLRSHQDLGKESSRELQQSSWTASSRMAELARRVALPGPATHLSQLRVWVHGRSAGMCCRPQQAQQEEAEEVEEFDQIEKLQQLGINAGTQSVLAVTS